MIDLQHLFRRVRETARLMIGVPDYETYVEHRKTVHPGAPIMTYEEFFRVCQERRYTGGQGRTPRCC